ncbi:hypothetical protein V1224_09050 [Lachnospiraceae bacterium JLR.KK008]
MKKAVFMITTFVLFAVLTGCGKTDHELEQYKAEMTAFTETVDELVTAIDNIDLESETRTEELLGYLDQMDAAFLAMGELEVPQQFSNIEELADEASENLSQSVELYHQAFDHEGDYEPQLIEAALEYYSRAFKRLDYIGTILQGELPEDETITIIHEDEEEDPGDDDNSDDTEEAAPSDDDESQEDTPAESQEDSQDSVG